SLIPGAEDWPRFHRNRSEQFEARLAMVRVTSRCSPWFHGLSGGEWPIVVSHGEGRAVFAPGALDRLRSQGGIALEYLSGSGQATEWYPANPNGSPEGVTGFTNQDGRVLILMPHPERSFRSIQLSWHPGDWGEYSPWFRLFENARRFTRREGREAG
ncbi:phosphoribosylformylglycinamidine synthase, partial [mine drainage metagenome]